MGFCFHRKASGEDSRPVSWEPLASGTLVLSCPFVCSPPWVFLGSGDSLTYASCVYDSFLYKLHFPRVIRWKEDDMGCG